MGLRKNRSGGQSRGGGSGDGSSIDTGTVSVNFMDIPMANIMPSMLISRKFRFTRMVKKVTALG